MGMHKKYGTNGALTFFSIGTDSSQKLQNANAITRKDWGLSFFFSPASMETNGVIFAVILYYKTAGFYSECNALKHDSITV